MHENALCDFKSEKYGGRSSGINDVCLLPAFMRETRATPLVLIPALDQAVCCRSRKRVHLPVLVLARLMLAPVPPELAAVLLGPRERRTAERSQTAFQPMD